MDGRSGQTAAPFRRALREFSANTVWDERGRQNVNRMRAIGKANWEDALTKDDALHAQIAVVSGSNNR